jgi:hypothetical protein
VARVTDASSNLGANEFYLGSGICDNPNGGGWVALCDGACSLSTCTNVLDYFEKTGTNGPTAPPVCASMDQGPVDVSPLALFSIMAPTRRAYLGSGAVGRSADWSLATQSRD